MHALHLTVFVLMFFVGPAAHSAPRKFCENHLSRNYDSKVFAVYGLPRTPGAFVVHLSAQRGFLNPSRMAKDLKDIHTIQNQIRAYGSDQTSLRMRAWLGQASVFKQSQLRFSGRQLGDLKRRLSQLLRKMKAKAPEHFQNSPWLDPADNFNEKNFYFASRYGEVFEALEEIVELTKLENGSVRRHYLKPVLAALADIYFYSMARYSREPKMIGAELTDRSMQIIERFFSKSEWRPFEPGLILRDLRTLSIHGNLQEWFKGIDVDQEKTLKLARTLALSRARELEFEESWKSTVKSQSIKLINQTLEAMPTIDMSVEDIEALINKGTDL